MFGYWRHLCFGIALLAAAPLPAAETDPPGRVGRISLAHEGTQLRIGNAVAIGVTALNWPLTTGALIETANASRTEVRIGSTTLRIDGETSLEFVELSDERIWLRLNRGSVVLRIQNPEHAAEMTLDTPQGRLRVHAPGSYRADVTGGTTAFSAYRGTAHIEDFGLAIRAGDRVLLLGGTDRNYLLGQAESDAFGQRELAREQLGARGGNQYISPEMTGHEDLDRHGSWRETSEYGPAWFPQGMPLGWAPYRQGRWAWVSPWGWTWIDHAPWGFAPFHYGRWALIGNNWAWLPGAYVARPIYAPALIVWLDQPGWNASFSFGSAPTGGWFPLGPREVYYPPYRSSLRHVRNINVTHVTNISKIVTVTPPPLASSHHAHRNRSEVVSMLPNKDLRSGAPVDQSAVVTRDNSTPAPMMTSPPRFSHTPKIKSREETTVWQRHHGQSMQAAPPAQPTAPALVAPARDVYQPRMVATPPEIQPGRSHKPDTPTPALHESNHLGTGKPPTIPLEPAAREQTRSAPRYAGASGYQPTAITAPAPQRQTPSGEPGHAPESNNDRPHHAPRSEKANEAGQREHTKPKHGRQDH